MKVYFFFVFFILSSQLLKADLICDGKSWQNEVFKIEKFKSSKTQICYVNVVPKKFTNLKYRSFHFSSLGKLLVFNSFGEGPTATSTAAKVYHFFPFSNQIDFSVEDEQIEIIFNQDHFFYFDKSTGEFSKKNNFDFTLDSMIEPSNQGGLHIKSYNKMYLDSGFAMGKDPSAVINKEVILYLEDKVCKLKAGQIFNSEGLLTLNEHEFKSFINDICKLN